MTIFPNGKRERGLIQYLQGLAYRVTMRVAHRYNWHYAPPIYPEGDTQLWCQWCGFRQTIKTRGQTDEPQNFTRTGHLAGLRHGINNSAAGDSACQKQEVQR